MDNGKNEVATKAKLFRGLSDVSRLSILQALSKGSVTVSEIVQHTGLSQPNVSNHLSCLRNCGLVQSNQKGRNIYYSYANQRIGELLLLVDNIVIEMAHGFHDCTQAESQPVERFEDPLDDAVQWANPPASQS